MISIITAIHNQLDMNRLYYESLKKYTTHPFELIIIDNHSTDGSAEYFESVGARVIRNNANYSYPFCQNQGIAVARYDVFAFLNNDIVVAPGWDKLILEVMQTRGLDVVTVCGIERVETPEATKALGRKWKRIKNTLSLLSRNQTMLKLMHRLMYGNWERFCQRRYATFGNQTLEGFVGNTVVFNRRALQLIGPWDERIQAADFDLYIRSKKRHLEQGDMKPCCIALGVFHHHYIRITAKSKPPVFADAANLIRIEDKWTPAQLQEYLKDNIST